MNKKSEKYLPIEGKYFYSIESNPFMAMKMIQIANPSYDVVFKYLMADFKAAKILLSALLGDGIEILELLPQERPIPLNNEQGKNPLVISVVRFDYCATLNINGEKKKVLIELQKGKNELDVARFRRYLGAHYDTKEHLKGVKEVLPIIAIYIFGFNMEGVEPAVTRFHPSGTDLIENIPFNHGKDEVVDCLTHTSYFVQLSKLPAKSKNRVSKILSVFSQHWVRDDEKRLYLPDELLEDIEIKVLVDRLHNALLDTETQRQLVEEYEYYLTIENNIQKSKEEGERSGERKKAIEAAINLKKLGVLTNRQIAEVLGLSEQEIEKL
jgi:predicted transposase/invertase (TIGR01784 family)